MFSGVHHLEFLCASKAADKSKQADQRRTSARLLAVTRQEALAEGPCERGLELSYSASLCLNYTGRADSRSEL